MEDQFLKQKYYTNLPQVSKGHRRADSGLPVDKRSQLVVEPRRVVPRRVFWPVFVIATTLFLAGVFLVTDRILFYNNFADVLPAGTEFYATLPLSSSNGQMDQLKTVLARIPNGASLASIADQEVVLESTDRALYNTWIENRDSIEGSVSVASFEGNMVVAARIKNSGGLKGANIKSQYNHLGQKITIFRTGALSTDIYAWSRGKNIYISLERSTLERMIEVRRSRQYSYGNISLRSNQSLSGLSDYQQTFNRLESPALVSFYLRLDRDASHLQFSKVEGLAVDALNAYLAPFGQRINSGQTLISHVNARVAATSISVNSEGINLRTLKVSSQPGQVIGGDILAYTLPSKIGGAEVNVFAQASGLGGSADSQGNARIYLSSLSERFGLGISQEVFSGLSGRTAVAAGLDGVGKTVFVIVADYEERDKAIELGNALTDSLKKITPSPYYKITDRLLIAGSSVEAVLDASTEVFGSQGTIAAKLGSNRNTQKLDSYLYFESASLVKLARSVSERVSPTTSSGNDLWRALEIISESVPGMTVQTRSLGSGVEDTVVSVEVRDISGPKKNEAERVLERLSRASVTNPGQGAIAIRDSTRRADLTILQNAINDYALSKGRAPLSLIELSPSYVGSVPVDPVTGAPYEYFNGSGDRTYYIKVYFEGSGAFGQPGAYCLTSRGVVAAQEDSCKEI